MSASAEPLTDPVPCASPSPVGITGFEGAQSSGARTAFLAFPTNSRVEHSPYTRRELVRKVRALDANLGIFGRIHRKIGQHAVGKGIFPRPLTRDKAWNDLNRRRVERRASNPYAYSLDGSRDLYEDQRICAETWPGDGEYFAVLARDGAAVRVQPLDVFEVETPRLLPFFGAYNPGNAPGTSVMNAGPVPGTRWQDGVLVDAQDRRLAYGVRELPDFGLPGWSPLNAEKTRLVPADSMIHVLRQRRARQPRGFVWAYAGVNDGIDVLDLKALVKGTAKLHSLLALAVRKNKGDAGKGGMAGRLEKLAGVDGGPTRVQEDFWRGAAIAYLGADEGIDLLSSDHPGENLVAFMEFLYSEIAMTYDLPVEIVRSLASLGGAGARGTLEDAQWLFDTTQDKIVERHSRRWYVLDTALAIQSGELPVCEDPEWWTCAWRGPAKLTVDLGRTADAAVKLMKNGALSHVRYYEERAQDAYEEAEEQIEFLAWLKKRCEAAGVDYRDLIEATPGSVTQIHMPEQQAAAA